MKYRIRIAPSAARAIAGRIPEAVAAAVVEFIFGALAENPRRVGHPLRDELEGHWSARRGEYRIVYRIDDEQIVVLVVYVAHRRDVYRPR